jgi:hypothetical protein
MKQADSLGGSFLSTMEPSLTDSIRQRAVVHHHPSGDTIVSETEGRWTGIGQLLSEPLRDPYPVVQPAAAGA